MKKINDLYQREDVLHNEVLHEIESQFGSMDYFVCQKEGESYRHMVTTDEREWDFATPIYPVQVCRNDEDELVLKYRLVDDARMTTFGAYDLSYCDECFLSDLSTVSLIAILELLSGEEY